MNQGILILLLLTATSVWSQSSIIFSRSKGAINTGSTINLMIYNTVTKETKMLYKGSVTKRGEYQASTSPDNSKLVVSTYSFGGWKLGIDDLVNGKVSNLNKLTKRSNYEYNAQWSHDGTQIVYQEYNWGNNNTNLFVVDHKGKNARQLTQSKGSDRTPHWSRDDQYIIFTSDKTGNFEIYMQSLDGNKIKNLSNHRSNDFAPSASKSHNKIAFLSDRKGVISLFTMNDDGNHLTNLTPNLQSKTNKFQGFEKNKYWAYHTSWSPDGSQIVFNAMMKGNLEIFIINDDGTSLTQITNNKDSDITPFWMN